MGRRLGTGERLRRSVGALLSFAVVAAWVAPAWGVDSPALDITGLGSGQDYYQGASYCTGFRFRTNEDVSVTALGFYDDEKDGIVGNHDVGIYDVVTKELLATTTVVPSDPLTGFFRYHALGAPVTLPANRDYFAQGVTLTDRYALQPDIVVDPAITFIGIAGDDGFTPHTDLHYPTDILLSDFVGDFGPSFKIAAKCARGMRAAGAGTQAEVTAGEGRLGSAPRQKAAVKCQQVFTKAAAKVTRSKFKALDACANAALACAETKVEKVDCLAKAGQLCAKKLGAAAGAAAKLVTKIASAKSCNANLRLADLLADDGLGFGREAERCLDSFALDVCTGIEPLAECLIRSHAQAAARVYGKARPRTAELLALLPVALPPIDGLESFPGCGTCQSIGSRKVVEQCGKALTKATGSLVAGLEARFASCADGVLACVQAKAEKPTCLTAATSKCTRAAAKVDTVLEKFASQLEKKCGSTAIDFSEIAAPTGLNIEQLATECAKFDLAAPSSIAGLADCVQQRAQCTAADLVRQSNARVDDLAANDLFGALTAGLTTACPDSESIVPTSARPARVAVFGSLIKFLKTVQHVGGGTTTRFGAPPPRSGFSARGFPRIGGTRRVFSGGITKLPFTYRIAPRARTAVARAADPPALIVAVLGGDGAAGDYFEVALDPPAGQADIDDEVDLVLQDDLPSCAFTLVFATRDGDIVSDYTPATLVVDPDFDPCE